MSIQNTTRTGKTYFLHIDQGKSGKPNYLFSTEPEGLPVNSVPEGFEIYENIGGQAFLRCKQLKLVTDDELAMVNEALKRHAEEWHLNYDNVRMKIGRCLDAAKSLVA